MLPYTTVAFQFRAANPASVQFTYQGAMFGKARRLHDLVNKGFFTPEAADCALDEMDLTDNELVYENTDYPGIRAGNLPDVETVKGYFKNLKYLSMFKTTASGSPLAANAYIAVPDPENNKVQIGKVVSVSESMGGDPVIAATAVAEERSVDISSLTLGVNAYMIPGSMKLRMNIPSGSEVVLSDIPHDGGLLATDTVEDANAPITGAVYVYTADSYVTVISNTLIIDYSNRTISGSLVLGKVEGLAKVTDGMKCGTYTIVETPNVWINDYFFLGSRAGLTHTNITGASALVLTAGDSKLVAADLKTDYLTGVPEAEEIVDGVYYECQVLGNNNYGEIAVGTGAYDADAPDYRIHTGIAHIALESAARRLNEGAGDNFYVVKEGSAEELGRITVDPDSISIASRVRNGEGGYIASYVYDMDPTDYPAIDPAAPVANFISGDFHVEYEELVVSAAVVNIPKLVTDYANDAAGLSLLFGQMDPRNELGFCIGLAIAMGAGGFYIFATVEGGEAATYKAISKIRTIFHTLRIADDISSGFSNWIDAENLPRPSRIKIGYERSDIPDSVDRLSADLGFSGVLSVTDNLRYKFTSSTSGVNYNSLGVIPGDTLAFYTNGVVIKEFVIESLTASKLTLVERFSRVMSQVVMTAAGATFTLDLTGRKANSTIVYVKMRNTSTDVVTLRTVAVTDDPATVDPSGYFTAAWSGTGNNILTITAAAGQAFVGTAKVSVIPADETFTGYEVYRLLSATEKKDLIVAGQTSNSPDIVRTFTRNIEYTHGNWAGYLPAFAEAVLPWALKLIVLPHMPLTGVPFDTLAGELGSVTGLGEFDHDDHLEPIADAGYFVINSLPGGKPFCESDNTCAYKTLPEGDESHLSTITPIRLYGKDTYQITDKFKGPYNAEAYDFLNMVNVGLVALKESYTTISYRMLGTRLQSVADQVVTVVGSSINIEHSISAMDPARFVNNTIIVE